MVKNEVANDRYVRCLPGETYRFGNLLLDIDVLHFFRASNHRELGVYHRGFGALKI